MFGLALLFVYMFLLSVQHFEQLTWGRGSWSLGLSCTCLLAMHTLICVRFSFPPGVGGWLRCLLVVLPGLFCLLFLEKFTDADCNQIGPLVENAIKFKVGAR